MSTAGVTGPGPTAGNLAAATMVTPLDRQQTRTEMEMEAGRKARERRAGRAPVPPKTNGAASVSPFPHGQVPVAERTADVNANTAAKPKFIRPDFERMPAELKQRPNWVLWVPIWTGSKWTKRPIQLSGFGASTTKPRHWSSFDYVKQAYERAVQCGHVEIHQKDEPPQRVPVGGVGFVFDGTPDENGLVYAGIDFDSGAFKGEIASFAEDWLKKLGSYLEASVSGSGLHAILKAHPLPRGIAHKGIELYTHGRFFTMTGRATATSRSIIACPSEFAALAEQLQKQAGDQKVENEVRHAEVGPDLDIDDFGSAGLYVANLNPSPLKDYQKWRDFMFACAHAEVTRPADAEKVRRIFADASAKSGGDTANNDRLYAEALLATRDRLGEGEPAITARSIISLARAHGWASDTAVYYFPGNEAVCRDAVDKIVAADQSTFTSGNLLVVLRVPNRKTPGLERWNGDLPGTTQALAPDIIERAERLSWMTRTGGRGEQRWQRSRPPRDFCADYIIQRRGRYGARPLVGIARVRYMQDDGSIRTEIGYDPATGIFVDRAPNLTILQSPTRDDALAALERVMEPFKYYIFEDAQNGPIQVFAANLTALERPYIKTAPMFLVNGPQAGTGKGQICSAIGHLASTGHQTSNNGLGA